MIKHISFIKKHADVPQAEFERYWKEVHAPLVKSVLPNLKKYVGNFVIQDGKSTGWGLENRGNILNADLVVELHFASMEDLHKDMLGSGWLSDKRRESSRKVIDYAVMHMVITEEVDVPLS